MELAFDQDLSSETPAGDIPHLKKITTLLLEGKNSHSSRFMSNSDFNVGKNEEISSNYEIKEFTIDQQIQEAEAKKKDIHNILNNIEEMSLGMRLLARNTLLQKCKGNKTANESLHGPLYSETFSSFTSSFNHMGANLDEQRWTHNGLDSRSLQGTCTTHEQASCPSSNLLFITKTDLQEHVESSHSKPASFKCSLCDKSFTRSYDLKMHLNVHFRIKLHICDLCGKQFTHLSNLFRHQRAHHGVKPYVCQLCNQRFTQIQALKAHESSHSIISCPECGLDSKSIPSFIRHAKLTHLKHLTFKEATRLLNMDDHSAGRKFYCSTCGYKTKLKVELELHKKEAHGSSLLCCLCLETFDSAETLKEHPCLLDKPEHGISPKKSIECFGVDCLSNFESIETDNLTLTCSQEEGSNTLSTLVASFSNHSNDMPEEADLAEDSSNSSSIEPIGAVNIKSNKENIAHDRSRRFKLVEEGSGKMDDDTLNLQAPSVKKRKRKMSGTKSFFVCRDCGKEFNRSWNYQQHLATHNSSLRKYICKYCSLSFCYSSSLSRHLMKHSSSQQFSCTECQKHYKSKGALLQHVKKIHDKKMNFFCKLCDKTFFNRTELEYHMRIHGNVRPYLCSTCGRKFSHVSHLRRHEKLHTGERPFKCSHCPKAFIQKASLQAHGKKHKKDTSDQSKKAPADLSSEPTSEGAASLLAFDGFPLRHLVNLEIKSHVKHKKETKENDSVKSNVMQKECKEIDPQDVMTVSFKEPKSSLPQGSSEFVEDGGIFFMEIDRTHLS